MDADDNSASESTERDDPVSAELLVPPDILEAVPEDRRDEFSRRIGELFLEIRREEHYSGPLQPASEAERWDALVPGTAARNFDIYEKQQLERIEAQDRILTIAEESARHRISLESANQKDSVELTKTELKNNAYKVNKGQNTAFVVVSLIVVGGFVMIHLGHDAGGIASLLVAAASVAGIFLTQFSRGRSAATRSESQSEATDTS